MAEKVNKNDQLETVVIVNLSEISNLIRSYKKSPAAKDSRRIFSRWSIGTKLFHRTPGEKRRLKKRATKREGDAYRDPLAEELLEGLEFESYRPSYTRSRSKRDRTARKRFGQFSSRFGRYFLERQKKADPSRGSLVVPVFLSEAGEYHILVQRDMDDYGRPKLGWGFVIGGPKSITESDEEVGLREAKEETGILETTGQIYYIGKIQIEHNYYVAVFMKLVPFLTPFIPGKEIYIENGVPCQKRCPKDEVLGMISNNIILKLDKHAKAFDMVLSSPEWSLLIEKASQI